MAAISHAGLAITLGDLRDAPTGSILRSGEEAAAAGKQLGDRGEEVEGFTDWGDRWTGEAAAAARHRLRASGQHLHVLGLSTSACSVIVSAFGRAIGALSYAVRGPVSLVERLGYRASPDGDISEAPVWLLPIEAVLRTAVTAARAAERLACSAMSSLLESLEDHANEPGHVTSVPVLPSRVPVRAQLRDEGPVIYAGDVESASTVITLVSGVGSDRLETYQSNAVWARQQVALAAARGESLAVVAWHDYDAPENLAVGAFGGRARDGAKRLRDFQSTLRQRNPHARLHVVGHSYGSRVVGEAADGLEADRVTAWGSPGMGVSSREQLRLSSVRPAEFEEEMLAGDPIRYAIGVHGPDPALFAPGPGWGARIWRGVVDSVLARKGPEPHSYYRWDPSVTERLAAR